MISEKLQIINKLGLHARATAKLVQCLQQFECQVTLHFNGNQADGKSMMSVMMLAAAQGSEILFDIDGPQEQLCLEELRRLLASRFGEPQ